MRTLLPIAAILLILAGCSDPSSPEAYVGTYVSGFNDTDTQGNPVNSALLLDIKSDKTFRVKVKYKGSDRWEDYSSGSWSMTTATVAPSRESRPAINLSGMTGMFLAGNLDVQYIGGTLRSFQSTIWYQDEFR